MSLQDLKGKKGENNLVPRQISISAREMTDNSCKIGANLAGKGSYKGIHSEKRFSIIGNKSSWIQKKVSGNLKFMNS